MDPQNSTSAAPGCDGTCLTMLQVTQFIAEWSQIVITAIGLPGNVLSFLITMKKENRRLSTCIYMAGLAIVDSCVLCISASYRILVFRGLGKGLDANLTFLCFVWFGVDAAAISSGLFLSAMTVDRALAVSFPLRAASICTPSRAVKVTVVIFVVQVVISIQKFFTYQLPDPPNGLLLRDVNHAQWVETLLNMYQLIAGTVLPVLFIVISNSIIVFKIRKAASKRKELESTGQAKEVNLTGLLIVTSSAFLVCSSPKRIYDALVFYDMSDPYWSARYWLEWTVCNELWQMNFAINFYVYFLGGGTKFRRDAMGMFQKMICIGSRKKLSSST